ncbi:MAG: thioredoxin-like domain-containing protein [Candidatus Sumerlaeia bacterium]|nr:thioredoxin-like domain-containing protein [Candidatus Sumerlaeia bacterium]
MRSSTLYFFLFLTLLATVGWFGAQSYIVDLRKGLPMQSDYRGNVNAPDFPDGLEWLNTARPLRLRDLRGKIVLLDFWTYCCINCMHIIPDLKRLEKKYEKELVVIGVHSAKFTTEQETENIRQAVLRYEIAHPVVNDRAMRVWRDYDVHAWPTLVLIDPDGKIFGTFSGEGIYEPFDKAIAEMIRAFNAKGKINRMPLDLQTEMQSAPRSLFSFPGKVLADEKSRRLFISDSNHNRIVIVSLDDGAVTDVIGSGAIGLKDGAFDEARFNHPQGMALDGPRLYVADTENHTIRLANLETRTVETIAGTGQQARRFNVAGPAKTTPLNSPWDLVFHNGTLYIAMAGSHQLWKMDLARGEVAPFAGSGREARVDGPHATSALAQPSGLATDGRKLYFADSEVSAIRAADLDPKGRVETIVGEDLFEFGDRDGRGPAVRLQHPLGVAFHEGVLYVADTYNNKIKRVSPADRTSVTFLGTGKPGMDDGEAATFDEPGGLTIASGKLYIADTNNHLIRVADLQTRRVETLVLRQVEKLRPSALAPSDVHVIKLPVQTLGAGEGKITVSVALPAGHKINPDAPNTVTLRSGAKDIVAFNGAAETTISQPKFPIEIPMTARPGTTDIHAHFVIYYCENGKDNLCYFREAGLHVPVEIRTGEKNSDLALSYAIQMPQR